MSAEDKVLHLLQQHNKPFNMQAVADLLATQGVKKTAAQKALDALAEAGKIVAKEFGKSKIYFPVQTGKAVLTKEELESKKAQIRLLKLLLQVELKGVKELESELSELKSSLTEEQMATMTSDCTKQLADITKKLAGLKSGAVVITKEEKMGLEKKLSGYVEGWRKRRGIFREIWDSVSENLDRKQAELFEEMGVETDADAHAAGAPTFAHVDDLANKRRKLR